MNPDYQMLDWDTAFFGFKVSRILPVRLNLCDLERILCTLKKENVTLVYWASDPEDFASQEAAAFFNGFLADKKRTYIIDLRNPRENVSCVSELIVEEFLGPMPEPEMESLAVQAGVFSRFKLDPKVPMERFESLYRYWIRRSVDKTMADVVFVVRDVGKVVAMITVGEKNGRGDIGLLAVDEKMRGKKIGQKLVRVAREWIVAKGLITGQVVTQGVNIAGCRLYETCGYNLEKSQDFYHFWL